MDTHEETVLDELHFHRAQGQDCYFLYKIRYTAIFTEVATESADFPVIVARSWRQEYGGINGVWTEYNGLDAFKMDAEHGVLVLSGVDGKALRAGVGELENDLLQDRDGVTRLRDTLDRWLAEVPA